MKQKLAVARAVLHRPPLIFLDEPTAGLDPVASAALRDDLEALSAGQGTTIFLTTHNLSEAERLCALIGVIQKGRLVGIGSPEELRRRRDGNAVRIVARAAPEVFESLGREPQVKGVRPDHGGWIVSLDDAATAAPIVRWLVAQGVDVEEVRPERASLEDAFLQLVGDDASREAS